MEKAAASQREDARAALLLICCGVHAQRVPRASMHLCKPLGMSCKALLYVVPLGRNLNLILPTPRPVPYPVGGDMGHKREGVREPISF
jgi:hypothetical protein